MVLVLIEEIGVDVDVGVWRPMMHENTSYASVSLRKSKLFGNIFGNSKTFSFFSEIQNLHGNF